MRIKKIIKSHSQQLDNSDCGIICIQTILKYFNSHSSLENLRELSGTFKQGTTMLGLVQCGQKLGFKPKGYESTIDALKEIKIPAILHTVFEETLQHYIVCFGYDRKKEKFIISNPATTSITYLSEDSLNNIWKSKALILFEPTGDIITTTTTVNKQKWSWIYKYIKEDLNLLSTSLLLGILVAVLGLSTAIYSQKLIDVLLPSNNTFKIVSSIFLLIILFNIQTFLSYIRSSFLIRQTRDYNTRVIDYFYKNLLRLPKSFFDTRQIGDMVARMNDTSRIQETISKIIGEIMIDILMIIVVSISIFSYNTNLGLITLLWIPVFTVIVIYFNPKIKTFQKLVMQSYARNESNYIETIQGVATIKTNNRESSFSKQTNTVYKQFQGAIFNLNRLGLKYQTINQLVSSVFIISTLSYSIYLILDKNLTAGSIIAILQLVAILMSSTSNLALINIEIQEAKVAFNRMFEFSLIKKEDKGTLKITNLKSIDIKDLSYRFAGRGQLLKTINIHISKGEITAIIGESGSGKSTIGLILQKLYDFENGKITINNKHNFRDIDLKCWRQKMGVVPQEIKIFRGNVLDNIMLDQEYIPEKVIDFCKEYGFDNFIKTFPQSYSTILGEEGINLSGGQKQIIALARAIIKKPELLILDEATSAMDRNTEKFTLELLDKLKNNLGILFISHRIHSLKNMADTIYVLEKGSISHQGNHTKLMQTSNFIAISGTTYKTSIIYLVNTNSSSVDNFSSKP
ncbi:MAG: peptidase C39 [Flavobacteriaceae bacterium]|nr:MAG: peptidase C39 [Flavobacteriaceae bacterium]